MAAAQSGDGGAAQGFDNSNLSDSGNGADGSSRSSANLSKGAIVAISVVVGVVAIGGVTLAILFYLAKKRQWQVRATIRRTTTRVVRAMTPRTATFGNILKSPRMPKDQSHAFTSKNRDKNARGDVEKGFQGSDRQVLRSSEDSDGSKPKLNMKTNGNESEKHLKVKSAKGKPSIAVPSSQFEIESPLKSPMWQRVFGRT